MCIIAVIPPSAPLPDLDTLERCWNGNPHGAGFVMASRSSGQLIMRRGLMTFEQFRTVWRNHFPDDAPNAATRPYTVGVHFRIGTHGSNSAANTHPWTVVNNRVVLLHNGIIHGLDPAKIRGADPHASDSQWYAALLRPIFSAALSKVPPDKSILTTQDGKTTAFARAMRIHVEAFINGGYPNKVVFMDSAGGAMIAGMSKGNVTDDGIWWSNYGWQERKAITYGFPPYGGSYAADLGDRDDCDPRKYTYKGSKKAGYERFRPSNRDQRDLTGAPKHPVPRSSLVYVNGQWIEPEQTVTKHDPLPDLPKDLTSELAVFEDQGVSDA